MEIDEVQCIMANLINIQYIKGYISHEQKKIVLSDKNPFPDIFSKKIL